MSSASELMRQPVHLILLVGSLALMVLLAGTYYNGMGEDTRIVRQSVLALIFVTGLFSAALNASASVAREFRNGTALVVLSKPVGRMNFLLAKFAGLVLALALQVGVQLLGALLASRMAFDAWGSPDWLAIGIIASALLLALLVAGAVNFFTNRPFVGDAVLAVGAIMVAAFVTVNFFNRYGELQPFGAGVDWRLFPAVVLIFFALVVLAAVVGKPDPVRGQIVKAFVVLQPGYSPADELKHELQQHCKQIAAPYKYPREIEFVSELPKTVSGKTRHVILRQINGHSHRREETLPVRGSVRNATQFP